jgi:hypothetical protein
MEPITNMYSATIKGLSADDLGVKQFAKAVADRMKAAGNKAITEDMFYKIISESMDELRKTNPKSPALKALNAARGDFKSLMLGSEKSGRRDVIVGDDSLDRTGKIRKRLGVPSYINRRSKFAPPSANQLADNFMKPILAAAMKMGFYNPEVDESQAVKTAQAETKKAAKTAKTATKTKSAATAKSGVKPKKFPGGFDPSRIVSRPTSDGNVRYYYTDENGKLKQIGRVNVAKAMGIDDATLRQMEAANGEVS